MLLVGSYAAWGTAFFWMHPYAWPWMLGLVIAFFGAAAISSRLRWLALTESIGFIVLITLLAFLAVLVLAALTRSYYSRSFLVVSCLFSLGWLPLAYRCSSQLRPLRLALVPFGLAKQLQSSSQLHWCVLDEATLPAGCHAVVVDWHCRLSDQWIRLLSECSLRRIPVYHAAIVYEAIHGRVSLQHMTEGLHEDFRVPAFYAGMKRCAEIFLVLVAAPILILLAGLSAIAVKLSSSGPLLFVQERVGRGGEIFNMYKFRSMRVDAEHSGAQFAVHGDRRVTPVGRLLRKFRLDELPQIWNVLIGDMSLIGPRPEQVSFVRQFSETIPFYNYRHMVRPGITGWAQVHHGYAGIEETDDKLEFDLYYIKYLSFWLDMLIVIKTFKTIMTGFGAR